MRFGKSVRPSNESCGDGGEVIHCGFSSAVVLYYHLIDGTIERPGVAVSKKKLLFAWAAAVLTILSPVACDEKKRHFHIGVLQWTEKVEPFNETHRGVMEGLIDRGYRKGINLKVTFGNAEQDSVAALKLARDMVAREVDLIVALGTGSSLAALKATENDPVPIVFSIVGAPKATGIIASYTDSGRNITGVSMKVAVSEQFHMVRECLPGLKTLGILYCTKMPQARATAGEGMKAAPSFGWVPVEIPVTEEELPALEGLLERAAGGLDAIYVPTDPILGSPENLHRIVRVSDGHAIPVIAVAERFVEQGALMALNCDFYEIGRQAAGQIEDVLAGVPVRSIAVSKPSITRLSLNLKKARQIGIEIKRNGILRADRIID